MEICWPLLNQYIANDVRGEGVNTIFFDCPSGFKQGCILSPMLFFHLIQVVRNEVHKTGGHGIQLFPDVTEILMLLFADDLVLIADSPHELQSKLNVLNDISQRLRLVVNFEKTKIVVFPNGGHLAKDEKWFIGNDNLHVVTEYMYLGLLLLQNLAQAVCRKTSQQES